MDEAKLYWTIIVCIVSAGWVVTVYYRDCLLQSANRASAVMNQLLEVNRVMMQHPDVLRYLSKTALVSEDYFRNPAVLDDEVFFKAKTLVYSQLNSYDEILSASAISTRLRSFLKLPVLIEMDDWETYFKTKLRHPLFRSILNHEGSIFGASLRGFWIQHKASIESTPADPFIW